MGPTPMLYYAEADAEVDGGIQITGSHNPANYNGFKMVLQGRPFFGEDIQDARPHGRRRRVERGRRQGRDADVLDGYVDALVEGLAAAPTGSAGTPGNGAAGPALESCRAAAGRASTLYTEVDGNFPNHHPDPTVETNLADLQALVADKGLDFGIAFDGDGDRIGAVDGKGRVIWGDQLLMILPSRC